MILCLGHYTECARRDIDESKPKSELELEPESELKSQQRWFFRSQSLSLIVRMDVPSVSIYIVFAVAFMRKTFVHSLAVSFIQAMSCWQALDSDQCFAFPRIPNSCAVTQMMLITYKSFQTKCLRWNVYSILHRGEVSERASECKKRTRKRFSNLFWLCVWLRGNLQTRYLCFFLLTLTKCTENPNLENNLFNKNIRRVWSFWVTKRLHNVRNTPHVLSCH